MTTSLKVAEVFGKNHRDVMSAIRSLTERGVRNFAQTPYTHPQNGQQYRMFLMDRKGFVLLVMGFTGDTALQFKSQYIDEFDRMEQHIRDNMTQPQYAMPQTFAQALRALADETEKNEKRHLGLRRMLPSWTPMV